MNPFAYFDTGVLFDAGLIVVGAVALVYFVRKAVRADRAWIAAERMRAMDVDNITPVERPVKLPGNEGLAEVLNGVKHAMRGLSDRMGDVERTVRLSPTTATAADRAAIASIFDDGADVLRLGAKHVKEA